MNETREHILIFNVVKDCLNISAPGLTNVMKNVVAAQVAIKLRDLVRVGGPYTEYDANSLALYYTKGRRAEEIYIVLEMVEPNGH